MLVEKPTKKKSLPTKKAVTFRGDIDIVEKFRTACREFGVSQSEIFTKAMIKALEEIEQLKGGQSGN
jgi:hypothetical protein